MGKYGYLKMTTDSSSAAAATELIASDFKELGHAAHKLANHAIKLGGLGLGTSILKWIAFAAAVYLLILDRANILTGLLIPYIFLCLPSILFHFVRGEVGKWVAFIAVILRLFFPQHAPEWAVLPSSLVLLTVVAPSLIADTVRNNWIGVVICLAIACYLLQEHIRASGGFRNSFTKRNGISNNVGIIILLVYPVLIMNLL